MDQVLTTIVAGMRRVLNSPVLLGSLMVTMVVLKVLSDRRFEER